MAKIECLPSPLLLLPFLGAGNDCSFPRSPFNFVVVSGLGDATPARKAMIAAKGKGKGKRRRKVASPTITQSQRASPSAARPLPARRLRAIPPPHPNQATDTALDTYLWRCIILCGCALHSSVLVLSVLSWL